MSEPDLQARPAGKGNLALTISLPLSQKDASVPLSQKFSLTIHVVCFCGGHCGGGRQTWVGLERV